MDEETADIIVVGHRYHDYEVVFDTAGQARPSGNNNNPTLDPDGPQEPAGFEHIDRSDLMNSDVESSSLDDCSQFYVTLPNGKVLLVVIDNTTFPFYSPERALIAQALNKLFVAANFGSDDVRATISNMKELIFCNVEKVRGVAVVGGDLPRDYPGRSASIEWLGRFTMTLKKYPRSPQLL